MATAVDCVNYIVLLSVKRVNS